MARKQVFSKISPTVLINFWILKEIYSKCFEDGFIRVFSFKDELFCDLFVTCILVFNICDFVGKTSWHVFYVSYCSDMLIFMRGMKYGIISNGRGGLKKYY